jgi:CheY-like chemotaxis protein
MHSAILGTDGNRPKMRILIAEDDAVTRKILAVTLERLGWDVVTAIDGEAAASADAVLSKPLEPAELFEALTKAL